MLAVLLVVVGLLAIGVAGCGDDDDNGSADQTSQTSQETASNESEEGGGSEGGSDGSGTTTTDSVPTGPLTKAEFIDSANAICRGAEARLAKGVGDYEKESGLNSEEVQSQRLPVVIRTIFKPALLEEVEQLRELSPPKGEEQKVESIIDAIEQSIKAPEAKPAKSFPEYGARFKEVQKLADGYGMTSCPVV